MYVLGRPQTSRTPTKGTFYTEFNHGPCVAGHLSIQSVKTVRRETAEVRPIVVLLTHYDVFSHFSPYEHARQPAGRSEEHLDMIPKFRLALIAERDFVEFVREQPQGLSSCF